LLHRYGLHRTPDRLAEALNLAIARSHARSRQRGIDHPEVDIVQLWRQVLGMDDIARVENFALEYELMVNPVYPMPGLADLLSVCQACRIPMGIISNAQFYTVFLLERFMGTSLDGGGFARRLLFFSWREGHAKPSVHMFNRAKAALLGMGIPAGSALMVGNDMQNDILPAKAVGFKAALFAGDRRSLRLRQSDIHCRDVSPDLTVTDLRQLIAGVDNP
jgi:putative hydrolase of the HAD superfamily